MKSKNNMNKRKFGAVGEKIAQMFLIKKGYLILETNFYTYKGEIDIIAQKEECIVFVEVKTRSNSDYGTPAMAVNSTKKQHLKLAAKKYIYNNRLNNYEIRFDVIEVIFEDGKCKINQIEGII